MRRTDEQKVFAEGMEILLELHYLLKSLKRHEWYSNQVINTMARLFHVTIPYFSPCAYLQESHEFLYRKNKITVSHGDIKSFQENMDNLHDHRDEEITHQKARKHFVLLNISYEIDIPKWSRAMRYDHDQDNPAVKKKWINPYSQTKTSEDISMDIMSKTDIFKPNHHIRLEKIFNPDHVIYYQSFLVQGTTDFAYKLISDEPCRISSPESQTRATFSEIVRSILVIYHVLYGSFDRIKVCEYEKCKRMFYEKRHGARRFCCNDHKTKDNNERQPRPVRLCRERHNQWLRSKTDRDDLVITDKNGRIIQKPSPRHVQKKECDDCIQYLESKVESGLCDVLRKYNKDAIRAIKQLPARRRKTIHRESKSISPVNKRQPLHTSHQKKSS
jgi:hypothetical protein